MSDGQPARDGAPEQIDLLSPDGPLIDPYSLRARLRDMQCDTRPICVFGKEADGHWIEVYEREPCSSPATARFVARLVMLGRGEHLFLLNDMTDVLQQVDLFAPLIGWLVSADAQVGAWSSRPPRPPRGNSDGQAPPRSDDQQATRMPEHLAARVAYPAIIAEKLAAFDRLEPEVEASFQFIQDMHGERCFPSVPAAATVHYLHALWACECKDCLLSVPKAIDRFEGRRCLELLRRWQETGETAEVVAFVQRKLEPLDFAAMTWQLELEQQRDGHSPRARRLAHGRIVLLNRGMNLLHALHALFVLPERTAREEVQAACAQYGHAPGQIAEQLRQLETAPYAFAKHPTLAQRNIVLMHRLGVRVTADFANRPGNRTWRAVEPTMPAGPYAEEVIGGYVALTAPQHNNPKAVRWVDGVEVLASPPTGRH